MVCGGVGIGGDEGGVGEGIGYVGLVAGVLVVEVFDVVSGVLVLSNVLVVSGVVVLSGILVVSGVVVLSGVLVVSGVVVVEAFDVGVVGWVSIRMKMKGKRWW
ncbi:hypothetical protein Tco_1180753 [Tanacetum coccineum]